MKALATRRLFQLSLVISAALLAIAAYFVLMCWYLPEFWRATGIVRMMLYAAGAHVTITSLLVIPWRHRNQRCALSVRGDICLLLFLLVLTWLLSLSFLAQGRPVALVFAVDRVTLVRANELRASEFALPGVVGIHDLRWSGRVPLLAAKPSTDAERLNSIALAMSGYDLPQRPSRWEAPARQRVRIEGRVLRPSNHGHQAPGHPIWLGYLPLDGVEGEWQVLVNNELNEYQLVSSTGY